MEVAEDPNGPWYPAATDEMLSSESKEIAVLRRHFEKSGLAGEKVPMSDALGARLKALGWPGDVAWLKDYYWADRLRKDLEKEQVPPLPLFDDPDWPKCWLAGSPAEVARKEAQVPATPAQLHCLEYFLGPHHGIETQQTAAKAIDEVFADPKKRARWEASKRGERATEEQIKQLQWWAAQMGRTLPAELDKDEASSLINQWQRERPDLKPLWEEKREKPAPQYDKASIREMREVDIQLHLMNIDKWRDIYDCRRVSKKLAVSIIDRVGFRNDQEEVDVWTRKFFAALRAVRPDLFPTPVPNVRRHAAKKPAGCSAMIVVGIVLVVVGCAYLFAS